MPGSRHQIRESLGGGQTVNVTDPKPLTNMRASGSDSKAAVKPPMRFSMEMALEYIEDDELVEATPTSIRLRKKVLTENGRKKAGRSKTQEVVEV